MRHSSVFKNVGQPVNFTFDLESLIDSLGGHSGIEYKKLKPEWDNYPALLDQLMDGRVVERKSDCNGRLSAMLDL